MERLYACVCVRVRVRVRLRSLRVVLAGTHLEKRETQAPRQQLSRARGLHTSQRV
jgi:hypothetical protein